MSNSAFLIFPPQLYQDIPPLQKDRKIYLVEENLYFQQYNFHKKKLVLHRASMKFYEQFLIKKGFEVEYINYDNKLSNCTNLIQKLAKDGVNSIYITDVIDNFFPDKM